MFTVMLMLLLTVAKETVPMLTIDEYPLITIGILVIGIMYDIAFISRIVLKE